MNNNTWTFNNGVTSAAALMASGSTGDIECVKASAKVSLIHS
ncbi:hypothetical protein [Ideonella oryzae]|nr:hypothetical protein [Ideonella oryzae]